RYGNAQALLRRLAGENRLVFELHTDAKPIADEARWISLSEVAQRNNAKTGYWLIIDQVVYDLTEFAELHPGGRTIVYAYAAIDAGPNGPVKISCRASYQAWVRALHLVVEMQNAHVADVALQDSVVSPLE